MARFNIRNESLTPKKIENFVHKSIREAWLPPVPFEVGKTYIFRTITMCNIGTIKKVIGNFVVLEKNAVWIPSMKKWEDCLIKPGLITEVERFHNHAGINIASIVDYVEWTLPIPVPNPKGTPNE